MRPHSSLKHNISAHNRVAGKYEDIHGEIYNPIEQQRLQQSLTCAIAAVTSTTTKIQALDFGCGSGNLTQHLLQQNCAVTAADVSKKFLQMVHDRFSKQGELHTMQLNGVDLQPIPDNHFDLAATYSVLHHIPDYLATVRELVRVVKPGGIIYIDHEHSDAYWSDSPVYAEFISTVKPPYTKNWKRFFRLQNYALRFHRFFDPRYMPEGDIHVFPDDHIEWEKIIATLRDTNCEVIEHRNYLVYQRGYSEEIYARYQDRCTDMAVVIARKG